MASNRITDKPRTTEPDTTTEATRFSFSRLLNRNGHEKKNLPPAKPHGPAKSVWREYFESAVVTVRARQVPSDFWFCGVKLIK